MKLSVNNKVKRKRRTKWARNELLKFSDSEEVNFILAAFREVAIELNLQPVEVHKEETFDKTLKVLSKIKITNKETENDRTRYGFLYVFESSDGKFKIGRSKNVERRLLNLRVASPLTIKLVCKIETYDYVVLENMCHKKFASKRIHGEWFDLEDADIIWIKNLPKELLERNKK